MALNGTLAHLQEAEDSGHRTNEKMDAQTERLRKMNKDMNVANRNLDTTEAIVKDMDKGYLQYLGESALSAVGFDMSAKVVSTVDTSTPSIKEGWLQKRGPMFGYKWERRWCALYDTGLVWYDDERKKEKKGDADIKKNTKTASFQKNKAPGDAIKHRGEKPFGFVLDANPNAGPGKERRLFYFDGESKGNLDEWLTAIDTTSRKLKKKDKNLDDIAVDEMGQVNAALDGLHDTALEIGVETKVQAKLVQEVTTKVENTTNRLDDQTEHLQKKYLS